MRTTKEAILRLALELFARNGYEAVSVSQIAGALGMTKGALYRHYESKRDIFDAIVRRMEQQDTEQALACRMPTEGELGNFAPGLSDFLRYSAAMFSYWTEDPFAAPFRKMLTLEQFRSPDMGRLYQQYLGSGPVGYLRDLFASMRPGIPDERAQSLAVALFAPLHLLFALTDGGMPSCRAEALLARQLTAFRQVYEQEEIYAISQERSL